MNSSLGMRQFYEPLGKKMCCGFSNIHFLVLSLVCDSLCGIIGWAGDIP